MAIIKMTVLSLFRFDVNPHKLSRSQKCVRWCLCHALCPVDPVLESHPAVEIAEIAIEIEGRSPPLLIAIPKPPRYWLPFTQSLLSPLSVAKDMHGMNEVHYSVAERRSFGAEGDSLSREPFSNYFLLDRQYEALQRTNESHFRRE